MCILVMLAARGHYRARPRQAAQGGGANRREVVCARGGKTRSRPFVRVGDRELVRKRRFVLVPQHQPSCATRTRSACGRPGPARPWRP
jgi:hypothetical protein